MAVIRDRPYGNFNFLVDLGDGETSGIQAGFAEIILPDITIEAAEYRNGNEKLPDTRRQPGLDKYSNVVLKRGVIGSLDLYSWINQIRNGDTNAIRNVAIHLLNEDRSAIVLSWRLQRAWPTRYGFSNLSATGQETLMEYLELAYERLEME